MLALAVLVEAVFAATACRTIFGGDSAELAAAAGTFGVAHPPGYPLYLLATGLGVHALAFLDTAFAANLMSGVYATAATVALFALARALGATRPAAWFGALVLAFGATFWSQATIAEVYTFDVLLLVLVLWTLVRASAAGTRRGWLLAGAIVGAWLGHRQVNLAYALVIPALLWALRARDLPRHAPAALGAVLASFAVYLYLPLASARDPAIDVGDPESWERFRTVVTGAPYRANFTEGASLDMALGKLGGMLADLPSDTGPGSVAALIAAVALIRRAGRQRRLLGALAVLVALNLGFTARYRISDYQVYFLPTFAVLALLAAGGAQEVVAWERARTSARRARAVGVLIAATGALGLPWNARAQDQSDNTCARRIGEDILASLPPRAIVFVQGDTLIHALWYLQAIEGRSPDTIVVSLGHVQPWMLEQLRARFPAEDWPSLAPWPGEQQVVDGIVKRLGATRPMALSLSLDPDTLREAGPAGREYGAVLRGVTWELRRVGEVYSQREQGTLNQRMLSAALQRLGPVPEWADVDSQSVVLQYALALSLTAGMLERGGERDLAAETQRMVLDLQPDARERVIARDAWRGLREEVPRLGLEARARAALARRDEGRAGR
jgi:hypothetical protein